MFKYFSTNFIEQTQLLLMSQMQNVLSLLSSAWHVQASELPLEHLLAFYGCTVTEPEKETCHLAASLPDMMLDKVRHTLHSNVTSSRLLASHYQLCCRIFYLGRKKSRRQQMTPLSLLTPQINTTTKKVTHTLFTVK